MNSHPDNWKARSNPFEQEQTIQYSGLQKAITTIALLTLGYYALHFFDVWPSTITRSLHEVIIYLIPSQAIYALQYLMARYGRLPDDLQRFQKADFGSQHAKAEAVHRMLGQSPFPTALRKARSLSGLESIIPASKEIGPPGLGNWDNSCYQNSILHGLASLPAFMQYIEKSLHLCERLAVPASTHRALQLFLSQLSDTSQRQTTVWTPNVLKSMDSWQQQDAQEYFSKIVDVVEKEASKCSMSLKKRLVTGLEALVQKRKADDESLGMLRRFHISEDASEDESSLAKAHTSLSPTQERKISAVVGQGMLASLPTHPMDGQQAQALRCQSCGFSEGGIATPFSCLTLNLGLGGRCHLEELLDEYTNAEMVEGVECTECTKALADGKADKTEISESDIDQDGPSPSKRPKLKPVLREKAKQITISRLPKNLVIHINRSIFDDWGNQRKNTAPLEFPITLEFIRNWCWPAAAPGEEDLIESDYTLKCVVMHHGRHENGHYVAFAKRDKDWYCFNDEIVTKVNEAEVLSRGNVFMLFYEAVEEPPATQISQDPDSIIESEKAVHIAESQHPTESEQSSHQQQASSSSSGSESDPMPEPEPITPIRPVPALRTASGSIPPNSSGVLASPRPVPAV